MARPQVPDTTALIEALRRRDSPTRLLGRFHRGELWLSAVAACELYVGTRSVGDRRLLDRLVREAQEADRFLVPSSYEWTQAGALLARRVRLYGAIKPRDHLADVLILLSAARVNGEVITANRRHFDAWAELARRAGLDVTVGDSF